MPSRYFPPTLQLQMAGTTVTSSYTRGLSDPYCTSCGGHGLQPRAGLAGNIAAPLGELSAGAAAAAAGAPHPSWQTAAQRSMAVSAAQRAVLENSGWVQVRVVNGSDDKVWWKVACHPQTDSVGSLRHRLAKGAGTFVQHLYRDGVALDDKLSVLQAGIDEYAILSTGHGASLVYGRKGAAALNEAKAKGEHVVSDRDAAKPRWSHAQPHSSHGQFGEAAASRTHRVQRSGSASAQGNAGHREGGSDEEENRDSGSRSKTAASSRSAEMRRADREKEHKDRQFRRQLERTQRTHSGSRRRSASTSSSSSSSDASSNSDSSGSYRHRQHHRRAPRSLSGNKGAAGDAPAMIMPVAVCRCHSDPLLYPIPVSEMIQAAASTRHTTAQGARRSSTNTRPSSSTRRPGTAPRPHATAATTASRRTIVVGSQWKGEKKSLAAVGGSRLRDEAAAAGGGGGETTKKTVSLSEVLNRAMPTTAKPLIEIGPQKEQTTGTERAAEIKRLQAHVKELTAEKQELEFQLKLTKTRAPPRHGLKTPAFPVDGHVPPSQMFMDELDSVKLPPVRPMLAPAQLSAHSAQQQREASPFGAAGGVTMPHYLIPGIPSGVYPYAAPYQWMSTMPPEAKAALESTITPTVATPGLLKTYSALYPRGTFDHSTLMAHHSVAPL